MNGQSDIQIRQATAVDLPSLPDIEQEGDAMFAEIGIGPFSGVLSLLDLEQAAVVFVAGRPPVGFACVDIVDGCAFIRQLSTRRRFQRRGVGKALIEAVCGWALQRGLPAVTLTTFRDVPWNGPFYNRLGFSVLAVGDLTPGLSAIRQHERDIGDDAFGPRVAMRRDLEVTQTAT